MPRARFATGNAGAGDSIRALTPLLILTLLFTGTGWLHGQTFNNKAEVIEVNGNATYAPAGGASQVLTARTRLEAGATLKTGAGASATVIVAGSAGAIRMMEQTILVINRMAVSGTDSNATVDVQLNLSQGEVLFDVNRLSEGSRFEITVPEGIAGLRGGKGRCNADGTCVLIDGMLIYIHAPAGTPPVSHTLNAPPSVVFSPKDGTGQTKPAEEKTTPALESLSSKLPALKESGRIKHQIMVSADYFRGEGDVTLPLGFSLAKLQNDPNVENIKPNVANAARSSDYFGATMSYSYGQAWFVDLQYARGESSGKVDVDLGGTDKLPSAFTIKDTMYQAYLRYGPKYFRGQRLSAYFRAGFTYVDSEMTDSTVIPALGLYEQRVDATDLLGNLGFGVSYRLLNAGRFRLNLQGEGEGFAGTRSQDSLETLPQSEISGFKTAKIDNFLYGGIGRGTVRGEYRLGRSELLRVFLDVGLQAKFTQINYPKQDNFKGGSFSELLWGPYVKLGLSYSF